MSSIGSAAQKGESLVLTRLGYLSLFLCGLLLAQQAQGILTNQRVVDLLSAGVELAEVFRIIATAPRVSFNMAPSDTNALMKAGVSEEIVNAMSAREHGFPFSPSPAGASSTVPQGATPSSAQIGPQAGVPTVRPGVPHDVITNDAVLRMVKSGLGDGLIITVIESQP